MPACRLLLSGALLACATAFAAEEVQPFSGGDAVAQIAEAERRLWSQGYEFDEALRKGDLIYQDEALTAYVQQVVDKLFPEFRGQVRVKIMKSPLLNAFALANGSIYINQGLLARFENEAQLAAVLSHEGTHFTHRHGFRTQQTAKSSSAFATVVNILGIPLIGDILALSSIFGYSQELEAEADSDGYQRMKSVGYDVREAPRIFEHLDREIKAAEINEPFFFSSHPKVRDRMDNFRKLAESEPAGGNTFRAEYAERMARLRVTNLEAELAMGRAKSILVILGDADRLGEYPPHVHYFLGEAYRLRGGKGDHALSEQAYLQAVRNAPDFAPCYRALGIHYLKQGEYGEAERYLAKYLEMAPVAPDRQYVESYLDCARKQGAKP